MFESSNLRFLKQLKKDVSSLPWDIWEDPRDAYVKAHEQMADTVNVLTTIQAENVTDTLLQAPAKESSTYIE